MRTLLLISVLISVVSWAGAPEHLPLGEPIRASVTIELDGRIYSIFDCGSDRVDGEVTINLESGEEKTFLFCAAPVLPSHWGIEKRPDSYYLCNYRPSATYSDGVWSHYILPDKCIALDDD